MRQLHALSMATLFVLLLAACGGDDDGGSVSADASTPADATAANHLGQRCSAELPCPSSPPHQCVYLTSGNPDQGYCSPMCIEDTDCSDGYTGPATGQLSCFVPGMPNVCTIVCDTVADCPGDLACVSPGGPVNVCTTD